MKIIEEKIFDEERAFYGEENIECIECKFDGPRDGESAFKEATNIIAKNCYFNLRYPFWHDERVRIKDCTLTKNCRAAFWYSNNIKITNSKLHGIKALRECRDITIEYSDIISPEFAWFSHNLEMIDSCATGEYFAMRSLNLTLNRFKLKGKYSFQYIEDSVIENCDFDTKDAFWHAKNVIVKNSRIKGEYLAWYSENITFINCEIVGTQPLCYCKGLKLINCSMINCDLSFEKSEVEASVTTNIDSVKNPTSGRIIAPSIGDIIDEYDTKCKIEVTECLV